MVHTFRCILPEKYGQISKNQLYFWMAVFLKGLITLCVVPLAFFIFTRFSRVSLKTREKRVKNVRKIKNASPTRENVSILHFAFGKNASKLRFSRVFLAFFSRFTRVLFAFLFTNANQKHSVIGA